MNNEKFYTFVNKITENDKVLAESIINAHKIIYNIPKKDVLEEGVVANTIGSLLLWAASSFGNPSVNASELQNNIEKIEEHKDQIEGIHIREMVKQAIDKFIVEVDENFNGDLDKALDDGTKSVKNMNATYDMLFGIDKGLAYAYSRGLGSYFKMLGHSNVLDR